MGQRKWARLDEGVRTLNTMVVLDVQLPLRRNAFRLSRIDRIAFFMAVINRKPENFLVQIVKSMCEKRGNLLHPEVVLSFTNLPDTISLSKRKWSTVRGLQSR
ncbi:hypothetical protein GOP47_0019967 [Adiantum capillus-veneris]|uniref:Uncharacterized protein n=1 Tax=Adiantum capillus-veneris TaxID=13818 RepID=A0A9D4Z939_ADICA|nr:hypothetical protein GOP47_0019967 [Adiantum capillus-veneris]